MLEAQAAVEHLDPPLQSYCLLVLTEKVHAVLEALFELAMGVC
jgi:hypothetical protein